jgi:hypothetical protein
MKKLIVFLVVLVATTVNADDLVSIQHNRHLSLIYVPGLNLIYTLESDDLSLSRRIEARQETHVEEQTRLPRYAIAYHCHYPNVDPNIDPPVSSCSTPHFDPFLVDPNAAYIDIKLHNVYLRRMKHGLAIGIIRKF